MCVCGDSESLISWSEWTCFLLVQPLYTLYMQTMLCLEKYRPTKNAYLIRELGTLQAWPHESFLVSLLELWIYLQQSMGDHLRSIFLPLVFEQWQQSHMTHQRMWEGALKKHEGRTSKNFTHKLNFMNPMCCVHKYSKPPTRRAGGGGSVNWILICWEPFKYMLFFI